MTENKETLTSETPEGSASISIEKNAAEPSPAPKNKKQERTVGNKVFDWGVYGSLAWGGVSVMSLLSGHEANFGTNKNFNWLRTLNTKLSSSVSSSTLR